MTDSTNPKQLTIASCGVVDDPEASDHSLFRDIEKPEHIETSGFFDPTKPHDPDAQVPIVLDRVERNGKELFRLREPIGYWDQHLGGILVPHNLAHFFTDLTSVPQIMTWLIPRTGTHLPAALIHDGLISDPDEPQTYVAMEPISRVAADRVFRDAMRDLGTPWVSRWLVWAAVAAASETKRVLDVEGPDVTPAEPEGLFGRASAFVSTQRLLGWFVVLSTVLSVAVLGTIATLDVIDWWNVVPGMTNQPLLVELAVGFAGAVVIPTLLSALWGSQWRAGVIAGVAMSLLLHITAALLVVYGLFKAADHLSAGRVGRAVLWLGTSASVVGVVTGIIIYAYR